MIGNPSSDGVTVKPITLISLVPHFFVGGLDKTWCRRGTNLGHNEHWFIKGVWSWLYSSGGSKELWAWTFIHSSSKLFSMCLKKSYFPDCWKVLLLVPLFKNVGERSTTKNYCPVSLLSVVSKVFEKLVNNRIVDHLEKCGLLLISNMV